MKLFTDVALSCLNIPYIWGGNTPASGMDCSGFAQWVLKSAGIDPKGDQTAQDLYDWFETQSTVRRDMIRPGSLLFFGKSVTKITHVAIALDYYRMIEAGGGGSKCKQDPDVKFVKCIKPNCSAMVRIRHIDSRSDMVASLFPDYAKIGIVY